jgi:hypothetical protein
MTAEWRKGFDPNLLVNRLERLRQVDNTSGRVPFRGFGLQEIATVLQSSISFSVHESPDFIEHLS